MLTYHSGAFAGSPAYAATSPRGRSITTSVSTSTGTVASCRLLYRSRPRETIRRKRDDLSHEWDNPDRRHAAVREGRRGPQLHRRGEAPRHAQADAEPTRGGSRARAGRPA